MKRRNLRLTMRHRLRFAEANASAIMPGNVNQSNALALSKQNLIKKSMLLLVALLIFTSVVLKAQSPQKINFQSIVRNTSGVIVSNKSVKFKITILANSATGEPVYSETHLKTTDAIGLVSLQIGSGTVVSNGVFSSLNWGNASHFIKLEADFTGGNTYVILGTQELMSVPYAMYAAKTDTASLNLTNRLAEKAPINNPEFTGKVYGIDKTMVGLDNVDNTSDANKPVSAATQTALDAVSAETKTALVAVSAETKTALVAVSAETQTALAAKAPINNPEFTGKVYGIDKTMVGLDNVDNTSDANKPVSSATQTALNDKAPVNNPEFKGKVYGIDKTMVGLDNVDNTSDANKPVSSATQTALDAVSAATQTALNDKAPVNNPEFKGKVYGIDKTMVGLDNVDNTSDANKPVSSATQTALDAVSAETKTALNDKAPINNPEFKGKVYGIDKTMVGLDNVDNTSDANKPVSAATQTALDAKAPINNPEFTGKVIGIDKTMVGLDNVDNTSDANKPVSSATQAALDAVSAATQTALDAVSAATQTALAAKAPINNPEFTGKVIGIDKTMVGLENVDNTSDANKPVSAATQTALDAVSAATQTALNDKAPINNPEFKGKVYGIDKSMVGLDRVDNTLDVDKPVSSLTQSAINTKVNISDTMSMLANYKAALDTKFNKADFPSGSSANEILYWNGLKWVSLAPGTTGQVLTMSSDGLSWGCIPASSAVAPSTTPTLAVNTLMTDITIAITGVTGIGGAVLPKGLDAKWSPNVITISGIPTEVGVSQYSIYLLVSCGNPIFVDGLINVNATAPGAPTDIVAKAGDGSAIITFVAPTNDGGIQITDYTVTSIPAGGIGGTGSSSPLTVTGLTNGTSYTFTVVATNSVNNSVASAVSNAVTPAPVCPTTTIIYNGYDYKTVGIGTQCWMAENLRTDKYSDGSTVIPEVTIAGWGNLITGGRTLYGGNPGNLGEGFGYLYNWYAAKGIASAGTGDVEYKNICPEGWHVPTVSDWENLILNLGGDNKAGKAMKKEDIWNPNPGSNTSGFSALPGGALYVDASNFYFFGTNAFFWSADIVDQPGYAFYFGLYGQSDYGGLSGGNQKDGYSIRCLRD